MTAMHYALNLLFKDRVDSTRIYWDYFSNRYVPHIQYVQDGVETTVCIIRGEAFFVEQRFVD